MTHETAVQVSLDDDEASSNGRGPATKEVGVPLTCSETTGNVARSDVILIPTVNDLRSAPVSVEGLRPRQVIAASLLVQGRRGKDIAAALGVSAETVSRWRQQPEFQAFMHRLLQETIDRTKLGLVSLCAESIDCMRGLLRTLNDDTTLKAVALILGKVGPVLGVIGAEVRQTPAETDARP